MVSVYSNLASGASAGAAAYIAAVLELVGDRDPLAVLESTPGWCETHIRTLTKEQMAEPEEPGKWSIAGVLQHLADSDLVWGYRVRRVLAEDRPRLTGFDQDLWADRLGYADADAAVALSTFVALRLANLRLIGQASERDLDRVGVHEERGEESLRHMIRLYAGHDLAHRRQIERLAGRFAG